LKKCLPRLGKPLATLLKLSFNLGKLPQEWKNANIVPVSKADNKSDPNNYRPISLLCIIFKVMETIINDFLRKHLFNMKLLSSRQYGFQAGKSTMDLLAHATQNWTEALHRGHEVKVIALDISRAFDRVWHKGLLSKLMSFGVCGRLYRWIRDFLTCRQQRVVLSGQTSSWSKINAGVPQGSILGPTLSLVFINDLTDEVENHIDLFADDTTLYQHLNSENRQSVIKSLQRDLDTIKYG
jgi:sarcosine oxidase/L-pipecolate oxidase